MSSPVVLLRKIYLLTAVSVLTPSVVPTADAYQMLFTINPLIHPKLLVSKLPVATTNATLPVIDFQIDIIIQSKLFQTFFNGRHFILINLSCGQALSKQTLRGF